MRAASWHPETGSCRFPLAAAGSRRPPLLPSPLRFAGAGPFWPGVSGWTLSVVVAGLLLGACSSAPSEDYNEFRRRTENIAEDGGPSETPDDGNFEDMCGKWMLRALLAGGIDLGLRIHFTASDAEGNCPETPLDSACPTGAPAKLCTRVWLERHKFDEPDILKTTVEVDEEGRFLLVADPLILPKDILRGEVDVQGILRMHSRVHTRDVWCGVAEGSVEVPITLDLAGSTFYAQRDADDAVGGLSESPDVLKRVDLPFECPAAATDAGVTSDASPKDAGVDAAPADATASDGGADAGGQPPTPDLSDIASVSADLTGQWVLNARVSNGLPLKLWLSMTWTANDAGGWIDGTLRRFAPESVGLPPIATFNAAVDTEGRFVIWLPDASIPSSLGQPVVGDILFAAATLDGDSFCGEAAGQVVSPLMVDLAGTTYFAERWVPGTEARADLPNKCPGR